MSKIGKKLIIIPSEVEVVIKSEEIRIKGPKGELMVSFPLKVKIRQENGKLQVGVADPEDRRQKALWGTYWALVNNAIIGVTRGFEKRLEIVGVGYKAALSEEKLVLNLGFSHPIKLSIPGKLVVKVEKNSVIISGIDKQLVGSFAALVRAQRPPEPYKGKGVKYHDEIIRRKAGKVVKAVGT